MILERPLAVFDSEYSSLDMERARMLSLGIIVMASDMEGVASVRETWQARFNPQGDPIDPGTTEVHGITDEMAAQERPFCDFADEILSRLVGADWGGYNIRGDIAVLQREMERCGRSLKTDGVRLVDGYRLWQVREPRKLEDAFRRFRRDADAMTMDMPMPWDDIDLKAHDALSDAAMAVAVIESLQGDDSVADVHDLCFPNLVDLSGKFTRNDAGDIVFAFGKHKGQRAMDNQGYLSWMLTSNFPPDTEKVIHELLSKVVEG